jgi:adenylosuccinate lyase
VFCTFAPDIYYTMQSSLTAISPIDGRYQAQTEIASQYFSEQALIQYRVKVEILYFIELSNLKFFSINTAQLKKLHVIYSQFSTEDAIHIKATEKITNHDVKAVEYFIKEKLDAIGLGKYKEWVHFGLTSQDINNTAIPMLWRDAVNTILIPQYEAIIAHLSACAQDWKSISLLARTHGQTASPTTLGKEWMVYVERLQNQIAMLKTIPFSAKFGGATGNFNAHILAYPKTNWTKFANNFVNKILGLQRSQFTTQIEHYDMLSAQFDCIKRINTILLDYSKDVWTYISMDYFTQKTKAGEIGSSAMPHKVNPIDFENAEGNLGIANANFEHFSAKLPISRLQRDLTDSTVLRNIGVPFAHTIIALNSLAKGNGKLIVNTKKIHADLDNNWAVVAEAIQTILRRENFDKPYEALKDLTRGNAQVTQQSMHAFIDTLKVTDKVRKELKAVSPHNYVGNAGKF